MAIAALLTFTMRGSHRSVVVPICFLAVIIVCARFFGAMAGILGSVLTTMLFALYLFEPYGRFQVSNRQALYNLALMLFAGIVLSYAHSEAGEVAKPHGRTLKPH